MNILIVDDDRFIRSMLSQMLNNIGKHEVSIVTNGHNAVSLLADPSHGFDIVFLDLQMPRLGGDQVINIIQDIARVNFVILTGRPNEFPKLPKQIKLIKKPFDYSMIENVVLDTEKRLKSKRTSKIA